MDYEGENNLSRRVSALKALVDGLTVRTVSAEDGIYETNDSLVALETLINGLIGRLERIEERLAEVESPHVTITGPGGTLRVSDTGDAGFDDADWDGMDVPQLDAPDAGDVPSAALFAALSQVVREPRETFPAHHLKQGIFGSRIEARWRPVIVEALMEVGYIERATSARDMYRLTRAGKAWFDAMDGQEVEDGE